jgi:hypothetical protein
MGEVNGNRISTSFLLPEFAAISIGVIQPCQVKTGGQDIYGA